MQTSKPFHTLDRPRVLVVSLSGIGNLLMASPLFRALTDANPTVEIDVLVAPRGTRDVLERNPRIRTILVGKPKPSLMEWRALVQRVRHARYDVGIVAYPGQLVLSASLLFFGGVRRRIGHRYSWWAFRNTRLFFTDAIPVRPHQHLPLAERSAHDVVRNLDLLRPLGIASVPRSHGKVGYEFPLSPDDRDHADRWVAQQNPGSTPLIGIHPGTHHDLDLKRWPADRWAALGDRLAERYGTRILVFGGADERALVETVCGQMHTSPLAVNVPIRTAAALMARCAFFVSNDSGLMHVAASQRIHTFGLFGPTDERRTAPWGPFGHAVRAPGTQPNTAAGFTRAGEKDVGPDPSLRALPVEWVFAEVTATLSGGAPAGPADIEG